MSLIDVLYMVLYRKALETVNKTDFVFVAASDENNNMIVLQVFSDGFAQTIVGETKIIPPHPCTAVELFLQMSRESRESNLDDYTSWLFDYFIGLDRKLLKDLNQLNY